jgi:hypothetical protein
MSFHEWVCEMVWGTTESDLVTGSLVTFGVTFVALQFIAAVFMPAPYGRHAVNFLPLNLQFDTKWSWIIQESGAFFVALTVMLEAWGNIGTSQKILLGAFLLHYFQRWNT